MIRLKETGEELVWIDGTHGARLLVRATYERSDWNLWFFACVEDDVTVAYFGDTIGDASIVEEPTAGLVDPEAFCLGALVAADIIEVLDAP